MHCSSLITIGGEKDAGPTSEIIGLHKEPNYPKQEREYEDEQIVTTVKSKKKKAGGGR